MICRCSCHAPHFSRAACPHCYPLVLFCGSRTWTDQRVADKLMARLYRLFQGRFWVMQGGAAGGDNAAWFAAKKLNVFVATETPNWKKYGRRAGLFRNLKMLEKPPQYVVALWDGRSRGTLHTIENAVSCYRIPTMVITVS